MDMIWKATYDSYMKLLYDMKPQGALLTRIQEFESEFQQIAEQHAGTLDIAGVLARTGLQQKYNSLYVECQAGANAYVDFDEGRDLTDGSPRVFNAAKEQRLPTVHEYIDTYRAVYESIRNYDRPGTAKAYQTLFDVEKRTDDLIEAQTIIEREHLLVKLVTANYTDLVEEFSEAIDPNFELTSSGMNETFAKYANAASVDEVTYMSEIAQSTTVDAGIQIQAKMSMLTNFNSLLFAWENNKRRIRTGGGPADRLAMSMVLVRKKVRDLYRFFSEDLGLSFDEMMKRPFYRIMLLQPQGLDGLWRIKKVMHPANLKAIRYILFEEILSEKSMEEILLTPQPYPYYEQIETLRYPGLNAEYEAIAAELNRDLKYYKNAGIEGGVTGAGTGKVGGTGKLSGKLFGALREKTPAAAPGGRFPLRSLIQQTQNITGMIMKTGRDRY